MHREHYRAITRTLLMESLHYPPARDGSIIDAPGVFPEIAWHLEADGWRKPYAMALIPEYDTPTIKKRKVYGAGIYEDAVTWVPFTAPDDPLDNLDDMTIAQIESLPEDLRVEAKRRLGMLPPPPPQTEPNPPAWRVRPRITIADAQAERSNS